LILLPDFDDDLVNRVDSRVSIADHSQLTDQWAKAIVLAGLLLVAYTTLFPFDFSTGGGVAPVEIRSQFDMRFFRTPFSDWLRNVLLFLPLGFGLSGLVHRRKPERGKTLGLVLVTGLGLSVVVEILQFFLPARESSLSDILANGLGTLLGFLCFKVWGKAILGHASALAAKSRSHLSVKKLTIGFIGYVILIIFMSALLQQGTDLTNWDPAFPLIIGNERTGDRPWAGHISELLIADRAVTEEEAARASSAGSLAALAEESLLAWYRLSGTGNAAHDQAGYSPDLLWKGTRSADDTERDGRASITADHWLQTGSPVTSLSQRILEASQFTFSLIVATADSGQTGPARVVSISGDPYHRNFTLGQDGPDLIFRLRTPLTGNNGTFPELVVPGVFANTAPHHLIITYERPVLRVYVDGLQSTYAFEMAPEVMLFRYLLPVDTWRVYLDRANTWSYRFLYYGLLFTPLGLLLAHMASLFEGRSVFRFLLLCGGCLVPAVALESILASAGGRYLRAGNLILGMVFVALSYFSKSASMRKLAIVVPLAKERGDNHAT
jgi:glycopeptide antibiotics resistance protein